MGLIHSDISGPIPTNSINGSRYVLTFINDLFRLTWVYFLKKKYEILEEFIDFKASIENGSRSKIKALRSDNGGEYIKSELLQICAKNGINIQHTIPYTTQQNGVA